jgi:hypothetical protein
MTEWLTAGAASPVPSAGMELQSQQEVTTRRNVPALLRLNPVGSRIIRG